MTRLEKSIRHALAFYGPRIRSGHYGAAGYTTGTVPQDYGIVSKLCCDVENSIVTDIRLYTYGDAYERKDYCGESIDITEPLINYLRGGWEWDQLISDIADIVAEQE